MRDKEKESKEKIWEKKQDYNRHEQRATNPAKPNYPHTAFTSGPENLHDLVLVQTTCFFYFY